MKKNNKKGFTLVELVIVVAVMAILVAVAIPTISSITTTAQSAVNDSNARTIESVIKLYEAKQDAAQGTAVTVDAAGVRAALLDAKLGIDKGTFTYNTETGECVAKSVEGDKMIAIEYKNGELTKPAASDS